MEMKHQKFLEMFQKHDTIYNIYMSFSIFYVYIYFIWDLIWILKKWSLKVVVDIVVPCIHYQTFKKVLANFCHIIMNIIIWQRKDLDIVSNVIR